MDTNIVGKASASPAVMPQIGDVNKLYSLARDKTPGSRTKLAEEISSILNANVSTRESELVADVLIELMRQAEKDLRQALSEKLSLIDNVPLRLVLQLANDEIDVAEPMLSNSAVLGDHDLMYIIKSKTAPYWQAIAKRDSLSEHVIDVLSDTKDFDTALNLAKNNNISLTGHTLAILSDIAQGSDVMALPLLRRSDVPTELAQVLYKFVGEGIKKVISENFDIQTQDQISVAVDHVMEDMGGSLTTLDRLIKEACVAKEKGLLSVKAMLETLRRNHIEGFTAQFSVYTGLPIEMVKEISVQPSGQGLALASKAYGIDKQDFVSIFMLSSKLSNNGNSLHPDDVKKAMEYYNKATPELALQIIQDQAKA